MLETLQSAVIAPQPPSWQTTSPAVPQVSRQIIGGGEAGGREGGGEVGCGGEGGSIGGSVGGGKYTGEEANPE